MKIYIFSITLALVSGLRNATTRPEEITAGAKTTAEPEYEIYPRQGPEKNDVEQSDGSHDCGRNPCRNGGTCFRECDQCSQRCVCPAEFTGTQCEVAKCFDETLYEHFEIGDSWARVYQGSIQACTCVNGTTDCHPEMYTGIAVRPCLPRGSRSCRRTFFSDTTVCVCSHLFSGRHCNMAPNQNCYLGNATNYLGLAKKTISGDDCLPWTSDLFSYDDPQTNTVQLGLGSHSYCRSPDEDEQPWCYFIKDGSLSWGYCNVSACQSGRRQPPPPPPNFFPEADELAAVKKSCGRRHKKQKFVRPRIVGGSSALPGSYPWLASINVGRNFCAGSLIRSCWLVTSAHCFAHSPLTSTIHVVLGQHFFNKTTDVTQEFKIEKYILHPNYSVFNPTENDIVLIKLKKIKQRCAVRSRFVQPICLPEASMSFPDHYKCYVVGWGYLHENSSRYSNVVQEALIPIIPDYKCQNADVYGAEISENMFCAGYLDGRSDACQGDSGGPLACEKDGVFYLYGIVSWGDGCGKARKPGVYTKVINYINWINQEIHRPPKG
ncbi:hepatocyte growth factor activator [Pantherophis guttatus]|uniref:Hepatocyte growth factor activator n=1 Tax=Pantherophis guttatus TaxID=94885 RepID=A0ABM3Z933_PANGU|nr:hepatocyte growth factor activator [Pantherophis guttatus]